MIKKFLLTAAVLAAVCVFSGVSVSAYESHFGFTVKDSSVTFFVTDGGKGEYRISLDGGASFFSAKMPFTLPYLPNGTYQLRVMYPDGELSEIKTAVIGSSGIPRGNEIFLSASGYAEDTLGGGSITLKIRNYNPESIYLISSDSGRSWFTASGEKTVIKGLHAGEYSYMVRSAQDPHLYSRVLTAAVPVKKLSESVQLDVPYLKQLPELPTGCEVTSLAMALHHHGIMMSKTALADVFLDKGEYRASDYHDVFVGDPREKAAYGCYAPVLVRCAEKFFDTIPTRSFEVSDLTGCTPAALYGYADMGYPVIVWTSNNMIPTFQGPSWIDSESGETVTWIGNEHCVLLTGYDLKKNLVYVNDPLYGKVAFNMEIFEKRFYELEQQAIVIAETTDSRK